MADLLALALVAGFFALAGLLVRVCDRGAHHSTHRHAPLDPPSGTTRPDDAEVAR